jgi:acetyltransferase
MATPPVAQELIVGASIDPVFGRCCCSARVARAVEVLRRPRDRAAAAQPRAGARAVSRTRVAKLLAGYRDHRPRLDAICDVLVALSQMLPTCPSSRARHQPAVGRPRRRDRARCALRVSARARRRARLRDHALPGRLVETVAWQASRSSCARSARGRGRSTVPSSSDCSPRTCGCASSARARAVPAASWRA